jgi:geranylgeranyl transferase type-1 subunit beta
VQHIIGGFSKHPGGPPDIYHSYLGLAALATMGEPSLKDFDAALAVTSDTAKKMVAARTGLIERTRKAGQQDGLGGTLLAMGVHVAGGKRPAWLETL